MGDVKWWEESKSQGEDMMQGARRGMQRAKERCMRSKDVCGEESTNGARREGHPRTRSVDEGSQSVMPKRSRWMGVGLEERIAAVIGGESRRGR